MAESPRMVDIYVMGKHYAVPEGLTILTALEYCGYRIIRGCGCRAGFCGACATIYNFKNCLLYTSPSPRDRTRSRMPSSA